MLCVTASGARDPAEAGGEGGGGRRPPGNIRLPTAGGRHQNQETQEGMQAYWEYRQN